MYTDKGYNISVLLIYRERVLNRLVGRSEEKLLWTMKLLDLVSLNVFKKIFLSELIIKCVIGFGKFVRI
jgi:hypothetical protein